MVRCKWYLGEVSEAIYDKVIVLLVLSVKFSSQFAMQLLNIGYYEMTLNM